jgi:H+-translocating NAD(P) transhydrogenase subunit alpha
MKVSIVKEIEVGERRVAVIPDIVSRLVKQGMEVSVEAGAGEQSFFSDAAYEAAGAKIVTDAEQLWHADLVLKVNPPQERGGFAEGRGNVDWVPQSFGFPSLDTATCGTESYCLWARVNSSH